MEKTHLENVLQFSIAVVKKLLEVVWKRQIIAQNDSYFSEMVNSYVFTEDCFTFFSSSESPSLAIEAENS